MKSLRWLLPIVLAQFVMVTNASAELTAAEKRDIIFDCSQLVNDYAYYRDLRAPEHFANLFVDDARMTVRGEWIGGRKALADHVLHDDPNDISMHMITSVKIIPIDENNATGVTYAAVAHGLKGSGAATLESFDVIGKYFDKFVNTKDGWKISEREFKVIFRKPAA